MSLPNANPLEDQSCSKLANYLKDWLNSAYPEQLVVRSTRSYDAFNVPYQDYPLLKVYRLSKQGFINRNTKNVTQVAIAYALVLPELETLAPILNWVNDQIVDALAAYQIEYAGCSPELELPYRGEFRTMLNELTQRVHPFLRFIISFKEF